MPNITPTVPLNIEDELAKLALYKHHPNGIINISLNRLLDMLDGKVEITDPSNPFTYLLETSCLNTAFAVQEVTLLTRKIYPRLANSEEDLYLHMSDLDYLGRFAEPAYANVKFNILFNDFKSLAFYDPVQKEYVFKIPRHFKLVVDKYIFTLTSAVIIRLTENNVVDVKFENQDFNNIFPVTTNFINFNIYSVNQQETYLTFDLKLPEVDIEAIEIPVEKSKLFRSKLTYNPKRKFYYFRAFYFANNKWNEMTVTHTDQVYDIYTPTCVIKVLRNTNSVEYYIPPVYINTGQVGSKVKFLIYTTNGSVNANFKDYKVADFVTEYNSIFPDTELDDYTRPLQLITKVIYISDEVVDGKEEISFEDLKKSVIDNSIGDRKLPITRKQLEFAGTQNNFRVIPDVDTITNRVFLLECTLPNASTRYPITKFNLDIVEYKTKVEDLVTGKNGIVSVNDEVTIIPEGTIFKITEKGLYLLSTVEATALRALSDIDLTTEVNGNKYLSVFYHYVLDTGNEKTELRAYDISSPGVSQISFKEFNATARIGINSTNMNLYKSSGGFTLDVLANLKQYVDSVDHTNIKPYLIFRDTYGSKFYLEGQLYTQINEQPVYRFQLVSNYYITSENRVRVSNFVDSNGTVANITIGIDSVLELIYVSNVIPSNYVPSEMDNYIYNSFLTVGRCVVTLEEFNAKFGEHLNMLYTTVHTSTGVEQYQTHTENVPARYTATVYDSQNAVVHNVNDIVLDGNGDIVYEALIGDVILDANGNPTPITDSRLDRFMNFLFIDYKATLSQKSIIKDYMNQLRRYLTENIVENAVVVQEQMLDNTVGYVVVPKNLSNIRIQTPTRFLYINSMQTFSLNVYVTERIYNDTGMRDSIVYTIVSEIDNYLYTNTTISKTQLLDILYTKVKEFVNGLNFTQFTELDEEYMTIVDKNARISLNKKLTVESDGYNLAEDITITFMMTQ